MKLRILLLLITVWISGSSRYDRPAPQGIAPDDPDFIDIDSDGIDDRGDNCLTAIHPTRPNTFPGHYGFNPNQANWDGDKYGDSCDNCPFVANDDQLDSNNDGVGDACSDSDGTPYDYGPDSDGDGIPDMYDNCPFVPNPVQQDDDYDGIGNYCDDDLNNNGILDIYESDPDSDGYYGTDDNCMYSYNYYQTDLDGDGVGDYVYDSYLHYTTGCDNCYDVYNPDQMDSDGDGYGDACDNCLYISNPRQINTDSDGIGDECDNCPYIANVDQSDVDEDGLGDVCDNCPFVYNPNQNDADGDGMGDCCEECPFTITLISIGNISIDLCNETVSETSETVADSSRTEYWQNIENSDSSSGGSRRRIMGSDSSDSSSASWYTTQTKCISTCAYWGSQRGLTCDCYESCNATTFSSSCFGVGGGYCEEGVCCCQDGGFGSSTDNRRLLSDSCSDSSDDSSSLFYSYTEWYSDRCGLSVADGFSIGSSSSLDGARRRQLLGARRILDDSSSSSADGNVKWSESDTAYNDFLVETCITYNISNILDCFEIETIFLPLCENDGTEFNISNLNVSDITGLITDETFADGSNVASAEGAMIDGQLGILVEVVDVSVGLFEICLGNITVSAESVDEFDVSTIDVSSGTVSGAIIGSLNDTEFECPIDGLPCFNFFFDAECPPTTTDIYRSCDCEDGMVSMEFEYTGTETVSITFTQRPKGRGAEYETTNGDSVSTGDSITVDVGSTSSKFWKKTGVAITTLAGEEVCSGKIWRCTTKKIGESVKGCSDLVLTSWTAGDGGLCDEITLAIDSGSAENLLINSKDEYSSVWTVMEELDPFVRYTLISIIISFAFCLVLFGYFMYIGSKDEDTATELQAARSRSVEMETREDKLDVVAKEIRKLSLGTKPTETKTEMLDGRSVVETV